MIAALLFCLAPTAIDGDTVRCGTGPASVRLFGVEAPERADPAGPASTAGLGALAAGGLVCEVKGASYSRVVALCRNAAGADVGKAQMDAGRAVEWCAYSRNHYGTC